MDIQGWVAIFISLVAVVFSGYSFFRLQKHRKTETLLQYGNPEDIDLRIKQLEEERRNEISKIRDDYTEKIRVLDAKASSGLKLGVTEKNIQKLRERMQREGNLVNIRYNSEIKSLLRKKELLLKM